MKNQAIIYGFAGVLAGGIIAILAARAAVNNDYEGMMRMMGIRQTRSETVHADPHGSGMNMEEMVDELKGKTGDQFDSAFLTLMTEHHEGALQMANLVKLKAKHPELKKLAENIVVSQSREIDQMHDWAHEWGYQKD